MIHAGAEVDAQAAVGYFDAIGRYIKGGIAADHVEDIQVFEHRLAFNGHVKYARANCLPVQLRHFQCYVIGAVGERQLIAEAAPTPALVEGIFIRTHHRDRQTGVTAAGHKRKVGLIDTGVRLVSDAAGADREDDVVIRIGVGERFRIADAEIVKVDACAGEFHPQG